MLKNLFQKENMLLEMWSYYMRKDYHVNNESWCGLQTCILDEIDV